MMKKNNHFAVSTHFRCAQSHLFCARSVALARTFRTIESSLKNTFEYSQMHKNTHTHRNDEKNAETEDKRMQMHGKSFAFL